jgi:hypothetical protein
VKLGLSHTEGKTYEYNENVKEVENWVKRDGSNRRLEKIS